MPTPAPRRESATSAARSVEREVRENILRQPFGAGTVSHLNLPTEFVRRCADRVIISSFNERYRLVVGEEPARPEQSAPAAADCGSVRMISGASLDDRRWNKLPAQTSDIPRGFRFPAPGNESVTGVPSVSEPYELRRAAVIVARSLAADGLARTALEAGLALRPLLDATGGGTKLALLLERAGLPLDLLAMLELPGDGGFTTGGCIDWLASKISAAESSRPTALREALRMARLEFRPTLASFRAADEAGGDVPLLVRLQLTRGDDWLGPGDGGSLDIARQLAALLPGTPMLLSAREDYAPLVAQHAAAWCRETGRAAPITVLVEGVTVSQWSQDNARAGTIDRGGVRIAAALLPRYASRADEFSPLVPGDSMLTESLRSVGVEVARSPLHLQGGNCILVNDAANSRRVLLIGEAEVYRNIALGLTEAEALNALTAELGADMIVVLPAASYHIDYEVFCMTDPATGQVTAFVGDAVAAERLIVDAGIRALELARLVNTETAARFRGAIIGDAPDRKALDELFQRLAADVPVRGGFPIELALAFTAGTPGESAVGNFVTFLDALDACAARAGMASDPRIDGHAAAALSARLRLDADRQAIGELLAGLGWRVRSVASHGSGARSVCTLNAARVGAPVLVPSVAGLFAHVDETARRGIEDAIGEVQTRAVRSSESQRRNGAIRCAISVFR